MKTACAGCIVARSSLQRRDKNQQSGPTAARETMSRKPYVTALIDTYNQERFIAEAIESVLAQDFPASEMEILVVDDGSTDGTREQVLRFGERVRYIRKENGGQASALNRGFEEARGEMVAMLDGDDVWLPTKVSRVAAEFEQEPDAVVVCHPCVTWHSDEELEMEDQTFHPIRGMMPLAQEDLLRYGDYGTWGMTLRREAAGELFPIPENLHIYADSYIVLLAVFAGKVVGVKECLTKYRYHASNLASFRQPDATKAKRRWACYSSAVQEGKKWLVRHGEDLNRPDVAALIKRHDLVEQMLRYSWEPPGRLTFFRHLQEHNRIYAPLWTQRYRIFRHALSLAGFALGYKRFTSLNGAYAKHSLPLALRGRLFPAQQVSTAT
jgi:glycosyltransferase involved in cell wall biosynthesis